MAYTVLKIVQINDISIKLVKHISMSYFTKTGKPRLGTKSLYHVEVSKYGYLKYDETSIFNIPTKREANKLFKEIVLKFQSQQTDKVV